MATNKAARPTAAKAARLRTDPLLLLESIRDHLLV
jgi:hypothetical protein